MTKIPKQNSHKTQKGFSFLGLIVLLALVPIIVWSLNYIIKRDFGQLNFAENPIKQNVVKTNLPSLPEKPVASSITAATSSVATTSTPTPAPIKVAVVTKPVATTTTPTKASVSAQTVTFTDSGFSPAVVKVVRGQSITFVNQSSSKMWVAANPFPTSAEYPDFNEKEGVASGGSWTFTFDQAGTWFYHNHYSPATGGKVVVSWN